MGSGNHFHPPLGEPTFLILLGLFEGPRHGWGIRRWVRETTGDRVQLGGGALFDNLHRLLQDEHVVLAVDPQAGRTRRRRQFYALTVAGRELAHAEIARIQHLCAVVQSVDGEEHRDVAGPAPG